MINTVRIRLRIFCSKIITSTTTMQSVRFRKRQFGGTYRTDHVNQPRPSPGPGRFDRKNVLIVPPAARRRHEGRRPRRQLRVSARGGRKFRKTGPPTPPVYPSSTGVLAPAIEPAAAAQSSNLFINGRDTGVYRVCAAGRVFDSGPKFTCKPRRSWRTINRKLLLQSL